ncbi:hypothetical protein Lal_00021520 [Lupinus albus]|uniref:Uncharacterized protein n=1 Tax=Lupinus albus TaxID=3870 RepID=A0A6A5LGZ6_LUPAL|nr:hypothetical protein Lalb_Chr21g0313181 [Lupinus albus]KAF1860477.1 hypothetical protein Lal_00021520 [Lupinus albus]
MTKSTTQIVVIEEQPPKQEHEQEPIKKILSLLNNFKIELQKIPFFNPKPKQNNKTSLVVVADDQHKHKKEQDQEEEGTKVPKIVRFPKNQVVVPPPLETLVDPQDSSYKTSNPVILWQVYALGAFFISRWAWARWNERKGQGKSPKDDGPQSSENE